MSVRLAPYSTVPPKVRSLIFANSFWFMADGYLLVAVTAYLPQLGIGPRVVGQILGAMGIMVVIAGIPLGMLSDVMGRKWVLIAGTLELPLALIVLVFTRNPIVLIGVGVLAGLSEGANLSVWNAIIADQTGVENRDAAFSLSFVVTTVSSGFGSFLPFFFPFLEELFGLSRYLIHDAFFALFSFLALLTFVAMWLLLRNYTELRKSRANFVRGRNLSLILKFAGAISLLGFGGGLIIPLIPTWFFLRFGVADVYSGPLVAVSGVLIGTSAIASPRLSKRFGAVKSVAITTGLSSIFMLSLAFLSNPILAAGFYLLRAAIMNISAPIADSYLMGVVSPEERGLASAMVSTVWRLPDSASTVVGGLILEARMYDLPFYLATAFYLAFMCFFYLVFRDVKPSS